MDAPTFALLRTVLLLITQIGIDATHAIGEAGLIDYQSNADILVLATLRHDGPLRPRTLISASGLSSGGLANLLDRLESQGLVRRRYGAVDGDRRGSQVELTALGARTADAIVDAVDDTVERNRDRLSELALLLNVPATPPVGADEHSDAASRVLRLAALGASIVAAFAAVASDEPAPASSTLALALAAGRGTRPSQIAEITDLTSGGASQLIDRLELAGLVRRVRGGTADGRAVIVNLTDAGRREVERRLSSMHQHLGTIERAFSEFMTVVPARFG